MLFIGIDPGQTNSGFSIINDKDEALFSTCFGREIPDYAKGKDVPDFIKNAEQRKLMVKYIEEYSKLDEIKMILIEGPSYSASNVTQISIGSLHGMFWDYFMSNSLSFAIVTPKSVNYSVFNTAKDITKRDTINAMKSKYPNIKIRDSNMADSLAMASLARKFYLVTHGGIELTEGEKEVLLSKSKLKGKPKGLIFKRNEKFMLFE